MEKISITLKAPHNHAGHFCNTGDNIIVTTQEYQWLLARGIVDEFVESTPTQNPTPTQEIQP
jgi:hypothetical protein